MIVFSMLSALPSNELWLFFCLESLEEAAVVVSHEHESLCLGFGFDCRDKIHAQFVVDHMLGHRDGKGWSLCESFGHPLVEAMAAGLPIVASDIAVHREICGDAARYFPVLSVEALAGALRELIGDPHSRRGLAARGRLQVEKFFWEDHVARLLDLLRAKAALSHASGTAPQAAREAV